MIITAAIAAIGCSVRLEMASPIAPSMAMAADTYSTTNSSRSSPSASGTVVPDSRVTGPTGNSATPMISAVAATSRQETTENTTIAAYLTLSSRDRPAGTTSRYRAVPALAAPAGEPAATTATTSGSTSVSMMVSDRNDKNTPLPATWNRKAAPSPFPLLLPPRGTDTRRAIPRSTGMPTSTASRSRLRHRRKIRASSERSIRSHGRTTPRRAVSPAAGAAPPPGRRAVPPPGAAGGAPCAGHMDAPRGGSHERALGGGPRGVEGGHGSVGRPRGAVHGSRRVPADLRADLSVGGLDVGQPQRLQHARRPLGVGG